MALTHEPIGKPGGPGLFHMKGAQLPAYIQHIRNDLMTERGIPESKATEMAIGLCEKWARGGADVKPDTRAKAAAAVAEWEKLRAQAHASRATITASSADDLPDSAFAYVEPGGKRDASGRTVPRSLRHFPIPDAAHIRNALARAPQSPFGDKAMPKIRAAAKKAGVQVADDSNGNGSASRLGAVPHNEYRRIWDLEDIHIVRTGQGDSTGRLIEAYAAVFGQRAEIHDPQGHYEEENDPGAFNDELRAIERSPAGLASVKAIFNHGLTIHGTPSSEDSLPYGVPRHISPQSRGLLTRTEVLNTPRADAILEAVRAGAITAQSYTGRVYRSDPELPGPGARYRKRGGVLPLVRRMKLGLKEYGLTPFPAFSGAEVLGVRMQLPGALEAAEEDFDETDGEEYASANEEDVAGGTPEEVTSPRAHAHSLFAMRTHEAGIAPVRGIWE